MAIFSLESANLTLNGPIIPVTFGVIGPAREAMKQAGTPVPAPVQANALIDTGASGTAVKRGLLAPLGLHPVGTTPINTPSSQGVTCSVYAVQVQLPNGFLDTTVIEAELGGQNIEALIGRDVLAHGVLIYQGKTGQFTLAF